MSRSRKVLANALLASLAIGAAVSAESAVAAVAQDGSGDPLRAQQWGIDQVHAAEAWGTSMGAGVVVAVVDSGVDLEHPDLAGQLVSGATFVCASGQLRPCGDGDWQSGNTGGRGHPHGTHVAGIIAAATDNGIGVAGLAPEARIMPVKVLDDEGSGSFEDIALGVRWSVDHGAQVINLSLGALPGVQALTLTGVESSVRDAIAYARDHGALVVVAAGNESSPLCATPAFDDGALCVVATDRQELRTWYSNAAVKPDLLTVAAPGGQGLTACEEDIVSTVPEGTEGSCGEGGYDWYAGTSMAAPHVAGVAALVSAVSGSDDEVLDALLRTARTPGLELRGVYTPQYGYGIVDAVAAVAERRHAAESASDSGRNRGVSRRRRRG